MTTESAVSFVHETALNDFTDRARDHLRARVLDTLAAATAGFRLPTTDVVRRYARAHHDGREATLLGAKDGRLAALGATVVNATAANALDIDDGHREVKGHPAAIVVPPALATAEATGATVGEFLTAVGIGYEVAVRAGLAIHAVDDVYTGTGSWGAVGVAAALARLREFDRETTAEALGTAEYHAPRTPIMRSVEVPGMTKDGIGWGAYTGHAAADLAAAGFTAAGTVFDEARVAVTEDLGDEFYLPTGYLKPYPCCRWTQPGVDAALELQHAHSLAPHDIRRVRVHTFEAATSLRTRHPSTVEAAEYSYPYPVAAALVRGDFTPAELEATWRENSTVRALAERVELVEDAELENRFPSECLARVELATRDDRTFVSEVTRARGARERPLSAAARREKAAGLFEPTVPGDAVSHVEEVLASTAAPIEVLVAPWQDPDAAPRHGEA